MRVCRRIFEWLGLLRFCAALPVRLRHQVRGLAQRLLSLAVASPRAKRARSAKGYGDGKPARPLAGFPMGFELLAAAGPALLLFKELFRVGRCMRRRGNAGKHR